MCKYLLALCLVAPAHALTPADAALADGVTTAAVIAAGGVELNPLGAGAVIAKAAGLMMVDRMPHGPERQRTAGITSGMSMGAAGWNVGMLFAPPIAPVLAVVGYQWGSDRAELTEARNLSPEQCQDYHTARMQRTGERYRVSVKGCKKWQE